jgi:hypothetical protein
MRRAGVAKPCVWRSLPRFIEASVDGLLHDKARQPGKVPAPNSVVAQLIGAARDGDIVRPPMMPFTKERSKYAR